MLPPLFLNWLLMKIKRVLIFFSYKFYKVIIKSFINLFLNPFNLSDLHSVKITKNLNNLEKNINGNRGLLQFKFWYEFYQIIVLGIIELFSITYRW